MLNRYLRLNSMVLVIHYLLSDGPSTPTQITDILLVLFPGNYYLERVLIYSEIIAHNFGRLALAFLNIGGRNQLNVLNVQALNDFKIHPLVKLQLLPGIWRMVPIRNNAIE